IWRKSISSSQYRIISGTGRALRWPSANMQCNFNEKIISGGGSCETDNGGFIWITLSAPIGNGWQVNCDSTQGWWGTARAWAVCAI
ncbi:hypothetical protein ACPRNU_25870, partial [Chromobacterium vaccinii]|uniref:hypothetical protein n=1 Tax=Chromobacterium vaccinii TaxID=1108595 RepID=UPI003C733A19